MNILSVTGTHGSGKSTLIRELERRSIQSGKSVYVVKEVARNCPYPLGTIDAQDYIFHNQMEQERYAFKQDVDTLLLDRTVLDNTVYYYALLEDTIGLDEHMGIWYRWNRLYEQAISWMPHYDIVIRLPLNLDYIKNDHDDILRPKDEAYAIRIDKLFDRYVEPFVTNHGWE